MRLKGRKRERELATVIERGRRLLKDGDDQEALEFLEDAVRRFPQSPVIRLLLATTYLELRPDNVAEQVTEAAELGTEDPAIQIRAGYMLLDGGDLEGARSCAARAARLVDGDFIFTADLEGLVGRIAARDGEYAVAEEKLRSAVRREPQYSTHALRLARFLWARDRNDEALAAIDESLGRVKDEDDLLKRLRAEIASDG